MNTTVFLGGGRITSALIAGLRLSGYKRQLLVYDRNPHKLRALKREFGVAVEPDFARAVRQASLLIVAVRPLDVAAILAEIRSAFPPKDVSARAQPSRIVCSLAAGIPLASLRAMLPPPFRWARAMPSPACRFRRGLTALAFDRGLPSSARAQLKSFFGNVGPVVEVPERQFDAFTVTYSTSHGYHALATLARASERTGLDRRLALTAAAHALADGILAWRESNLSLEELLEEAATPGGIAATVMNTMDQHGHARVVERGIRAGLARARRNASSQLKAKAQR